MQVWKCVMWLGETEIKANSKIIHDPSLKVIFCSLPLLAIRFIDLISITNLSVNKDIIYIQRMFIIKQKTWLSSSVFPCFSLSLSLKCISYLLHKPVLHISSRVFLYSHSIPNHSNCFLLLPFWAWRDYALQLQMILFYNWMGNPKWARVNKQRQNWSFKLHLQLPSSIICRGLLMQYILDFREHCKISAQRHSNRRAEI